MNYVFLISCCLAKIFGHVLLDINVRKTIIINLIHPMFLSIHVTTQNPDVTSKTLCLDLQTEKNAK